jgi:hypothetical protein
MRHGALMTLVNQTRSLSYKTTLSSVAVIVHNLKIQDFRGELGRIAFGVAFFDPLLFELFDAKIGLKEAFLVVHFFNAKNATTYPQGRPRTDL